MKPKLAPLTKNSDEFGTPQALFDELNDEFQFTIDAAASPSNRKIDPYISSDLDAFKFDFQGQRIWVNPPYCGSGTVAKWVRLMKFWVVDQEEKLRAKLAVMLVPTKTEQEWFHEYLGKPWFEVRFCKGRLKFEGGATSARDSHMIIIFRRPRKYT